MSRSRVCIHAGVVLVALAGGAGGAAPTSRAVGVRELNVNPPPPPGRRLQPREIKSPITDAINYTHIRAWW